MITTLIIAFREFLEAFLLIGIFIGIDKKLHLGRRREILFASLLGIFISLLFPFVVFIFANNIHGLLTEKNADFVEGYLLVFSGFFLAYVVFSLHTYMGKLRNEVIAKTNEKLQKNIFDISLFLTIVFFILREGFEVALLIATTSLFSSLWINLSGLLLGFLLASFVGLSTVATYIKLPIGKVFKYTEYLILLVGAAMVKNGISLLFENYFKIHLEKIFPLPLLQFLPNETSIWGHLLKNISGLQRNFGIIELGIMLAYIILIQFIWKTKKVAVGNSLKDK